MGRQHKAEWEAAEPDREFLLSWPLTVFSQGLQVILEVLMQIEPAGLMQGSPRSLILAIAG